MKTVINLYGGPCAGKSTLAAELFAALKRSQFNVELVSEYAKSLVYENRNDILMNDQLYIAAKQWRKISSVFKNDNADVIVTDSPIKLCKYYFVPERQVIDAYPFFHIIDSLDSAYNTIDVFIERGPFEYKFEGRTQTESEAIAMDDDIRELCGENYIEFKAGTPVDSLFDIVYRRLSECI